MSGGVVDCGSLLPLCGGGSLLPVARSKKTRGRPLAPPRTEQAPPSAKREQAPAFHNVLLPLVIALLLASPAVAETLRNDRYVIESARDGTVTLTVAGLSQQRFSPEFTVLWSDADPKCARVATHPNYPAAPRSAVRWRNSNESLESLNAWVGSAGFRSATGMTGQVSGEGKKRVWDYRDTQGKTKVHVAGDYALDTTRPFTVGQKEVLRPIRSAGFRWEYQPAGDFAFAAELRLPPGDADPLVTYTLTPRRAAFYSVAFTGAPAWPVAETITVPQEIDARGHKLFNFVIAEMDIRLPRAQIATGQGSFALAAEAAESRFRLPTPTDSRFGFMLAEDVGQLKPVLLAPLLGGAESRMAAGAPWRFSFRCVLRAGDWEETYTHIARSVQGFYDQRDNTGPGSLNGTLERVMDFITDRRGGNHAMWDPEQKYFDYFNDKTGIYKPFSPLYGLSAAVVTDDEEAFRQRARPAIEYALSRQTSVFAPYDNADNKQANSAGRLVGAPYLGYAQLITLHQLFQERTPVFRALAEAKGPVKSNLADALAHWRLTGAPADLQEAVALGKKAGDRETGFGEEDFFNLLDLADATGDPAQRAAAREAAYHQAARLNLFPAPPDSLVTVDRGGHAPIHLHSFGRHHNQWGYPPPEPVATPEQTVPAWRIARTGLPGTAYPIEYWMNNHGALMRTAGLLHDSFLRDLARWGMVGRFGNFPGDNRSQDSLIQEQPLSVEAPPWNWNFATVNAGHAWDFAGAVVDFLVSDCFERSGGAIDFPALPAPGSSFRVRIYGGKTGKFFGDENVHLWIPNGLVESHSRQLDWLAGYGNGQLYLALWNQSGDAIDDTVSIDPALAELENGSRGRAWSEGGPSGSPAITGSALQVKIASKGMAAFAIPATVHPRLQARLYDDLPALPAESFAVVEAPFGKVHAALLRAGNGLTSAFVYAEALPENVIAARLHWRQGNGKWHQKEDAIYPYEFSPELVDTAGEFECYLEIEGSPQTAGRSKWERSSSLKLSLGAGPRANNEQPALAGDFTKVGFYPGGRTRDEAVFPAPGPATVSADFLSYFEHAANEHEFGRHDDGRFYPYSTPLGRRIAWRQPVWDEALYAQGCTAEQAEEHLSEALGKAQQALTAKLAARQPPVDFAHLDLQQQEMLLDLAATEGAMLGGAFVDAVLARDWETMVGEVLYVRYAGHAPDHARNRAFAGRWKIP